MIRRIRGNKPEERVVSAATDNPIKVDTEAPFERPSSKDRSEAREKNVTANRSTNIRVPEETGSSAKTTMKRGSLAKSATSQVIREKTPPRDVIPPKKEPRFRRPVAAPKEETTAPKEPISTRRSVSPPKKEPISTRRSVSPPKKEPISTRRSVSPPKKGSAPRKAVMRKKVESEERKLDVESERESDAESITASEAESGSGSESSGSEESENDLESESESKSREKRVKDKKKEPISRPVRGKKVLSQSEDEEESEGNNKEVSSRLSLRKKGEEGKKYVSNNVVQRIRLPVFDNRYKVVNLPDRPDVKQYVTPQILSAKAREIKTIIHIDENRLTDKKTKRDDGYFYKREEINTYAANLGIPTNLGKPEKNRRIREKIHAYKLESD